LNKKKVAKKNSRLSKNLSKNCASLAACSKLAPQSGAQTVEHAGARFRLFFIEFFEGHFLTIKRSMNEMSQILLLVQSLMWTKESTTDTKFPRFHSAILFH
jgi:hypothetical protein